MRKRSFTLRMRDISRQNKWWGGISDEAREYVNKLIAEWPFRMFEIKDGYLYLLLNHHRYINFRDSKVVKVAKFNGKNGYYYQTTTI